MQEQLNDQFALISVPLELLYETGIAEGEIIQMSVDNGRLIIEPAESGDFICNNDCSSCPLADKCEESEASKNE